MPLTKLLTATVLATGLTTALPAHAESDLGKVLTGVATTIVNQEMDKAAYLEAQRTNTVAAYRAYLQRFPQGIYRGNAQQQLARLGAPVTTTPKPATGAGPAATEAALNLSRAQRITIQRQLTLLGYDAGGADGLWGSKTRSAIQRWQKAQKLAVTGYVTSAQVSALGKQAEAKGGATRGVKTGSPALEESLLSLSVSEKRELQSRLTWLGYDTRGVDGIFGSGTRAAIARWQGDHGKKATGYFTADQVRALRTETRG